MSSRATEHTPTIGILPRSDLLWEGAVCASLDPELFFPKKGSQLGKRAKAYCQTCPCLEECREYGKGEEFGIWGGTSNGDRGIRRG